MPYKSQVHNIPVLLSPKCLTVSEILYKINVFYRVYIYVHV